MFQNKITEKMIVLQVFMRLLPIVLKLVNGLEGSDYIYTMSGLPVVILEALMAPLMA